MLRPDPGRARVPLVPLAPVELAPCHDSIFSGTAEAVPSPIVLMESIGTSDVGHKSFFELFVVA